MKKSSICNIQMKPLLEAIVMNDRDEKDTHGNCRVAQTDAEGNANLCCCYLLDPDGQYIDPCYLPVKDCCL